MGHDGSLAPAEVGCAIVTVSDSRTDATDASGRLIRELLEAVGHPVRSQVIVADEAIAIRGALRTAVMRNDVSAVLVTGGTGIAARDVTTESAADLWTHELPGFGELFRALSFAEIGPPALLSRATAGVIGGKFVALLPGSTRGCRLALERLIVPVLGHVAALLGSGT